MDPLLSLHQAAKRGGQCGPNFTKVTRHLGPAPKPPAEPGPAWQALLGRHTDAVRRFIEMAATRVGEAPSTAVIFYDQNKAFERISLQWMGELHRKWRLPPWLLHALNSL
eukprot:7416446-Pyramimonas_sp.AAC.1